MSRGTSRSRWVPRMLAAAALSAALTAAGCTQAEEPSTLDAVGDALARISADADTRLGQLWVNPEGLFVVASGAEGLTSQRLEPAADPQPYTLKTALLDPGFDADALTREVSELAAACDGDSYQVNLFAVTPTSHLSNVTCGEESSGARIDGEPAKALSGDWSLADLGTVVDEVRALAPSGMIEQLLLLPEGYHATLATSAKDDACAPTVLRDLAGSDASVVCGTPSMNSPTDLSTISAEQLADAIAEISKGSVPVDPTIFIEQKDGAPTLRINNTSVPLT